MPGIETIYLGELRTEATHLLSGNKLITDAPPDNQGRGEYFSPTDLVATALGSCMVTVMGIAARTHNFNIDGTRLTITKIMTQEAPRRIAEIVIDLDFPHEDYPEKVKKIIEYTVKNCPVALSLHPDVKQNVTLHYH
ncbi:MAG: OsmC family protein [Bacteroidetes bacterium]|nr:OsmC family protein [Bacteroidota bacterium]